MSFPLTVGILQVVIGEDALVEEHADGFVDLRGQKVADADEQLVADGELLVGVVIPVGLFEILVGKGLQVDEIAGLRLGEDVRALHEGHVEGAVAGDDRVLDLVRRLLGLGDLDVQPVLHGEVALEDRRGDRVRRVLLRGHVNRREPGVGFRVGVVDHEFVALEVRFGKIVGDDGLRFSLLRDDFGGKLRFGRGGFVRILAALAAGGHGQQEQGGKKEGGDSLVHFDFLSEKYLR